MQAYIFKTMHFHFRCSFSTTFSALLGARLPGVPKTPGDPGTPEIGGGGVSPVRDVG